MSTLQDEDESIFDCPWTLDDFLIGKPLGKGRFGRVYVAKENRTKYQHLVAIKILFKSSLIKNDTIENFQRECQIHLTLKHPNIIDFYGWFYDEERIFFILEYAPNGNLFNKITQSPLEQSEAATYFLHTVKGLSYIHSKHIVHRDLKPENLLIGNFNEIKIADFGWSNKTLDVELLDEENVCKSLAGTIEYLSPEIILKTGHDRKVDIWCLGVLLYEMLVGSPPFTANNNKKVFENIVKVKYHIPGNISKEAKSLITKILVKKPSQRIELKDILNSDWINLHANKDEIYMQYYNYESNC